MLRSTGRLLRRVGIEVLGWVLVLLGIAALVLPGPGLVLLALGLFVLSTQYEWAQRRLEPVKEAALRTAADSVRTWPRILGSCLGVAWLLGLGALWVAQPDVPGWWPLADRWWLPGGLGTGSSLVLSGLIAGGLVGYSLVRFRNGAADDDGRAQV